MANTTLNFSIHPEFLDKIHAPIEHQEVISNNGYKYENNDTVAETTPSPATFVLLFSLLR